MIDYKCKSCKHRLTDHFNDTPRPTLGMEAVINKQGDEVLISLDNKYCKECNGSDSYPKCKGYSLEMDDGVVVKVDVVSTLYSILRRLGH